MWTTLLAIANIIALVKQYESRGNLRQKKYLKSAAMHFLQKCNLSSMGDFQMRH